MWQRAAARVKFSFPHGHGVLELSKIHLFSRLL